MIMPKTLFIVCAAPLLYVRQILVCHFLSGQLCAAADANAFGYYRNAPVVYVAVGRLPPTSAPLAITAFSATME